MATQFKAEPAKVCPGCTVSELDNTIPQLFVGQVNSTIVAKLRTDPSINYVATCKARRFRSAMTPCSRHR